MINPISFFLEFTQSIWKHRESPSRKPISPLSYTDIQTLFDFNIGSEPCTLDDIQTILRDFFTYSIDPSHPFAMTQLFTGLHPIGWCGDILGSLANTTMATVEAAPVATHLETTLIRALITQFGLPDGEGLMTSGGSLSNLMALLCARQKAFPDLQKKGLSSAPPLAIFVSADAHYSFAQAVTISGIGLDGLWSVPTNAHGEMIPSELELSIQKSITKGQHPLMIVATAGTTTRGSIDPIEALVSIAKKYSLWLHVDATWGGSLLFSSTYRLRLKGIEQADSLAWDAHKTFGIPLSCAVFICKQKGLLKKISAVGKSDYLFQESEDKDANLGELSLQCGRRIDALKLWLIWKSLGTIGLESWMDNAVHLAQQAQAFIQADSRFELLSEAHSFAVCFRPTHQLNHAENHVDTLQKTLRASGTVLINRVTVNNQRAFRLITTHYQLTFEDIKTLLHHIDVTSHSLGD